MKNVLLAIAVLTVVVGYAQQTPEKQNPGSLFNGAYVNPLTDRVARRTGDILTVIVSENTVATYAANTETSKNETGSFSPGFIFDIVERLFRGFTASSSRSSKGDGKTTHTNKIDSKLSVVVTQVMPNGNLMVEGHRSLTTNRDTETIVFSGIVRPFDIKSDNTVLSSQVAELKLSLAGKGQIQDKQKKGLITTVLDWLF